MAITANVTNGKLDKTNTTPTQNRKTSSAKASGSNLGYDDFLKLLSAEMQYQDPLEPTSNTDYVAQMATFSQLEATLSMKESMSSSYDQTTKSAALSLVGKEVIVTDKDSASGYYSGKVDYVTYKDGKIQLSINEKMYDYIFKSYSKASKDRGSDDRFKGQHRGSKKAVRRTFGLWQAVYKCQ